MRSGDIRRAVHDGLSRIGEKVWTPPERMGTTPTEQGPGLRLGERSPRSGGKKSLSGLGDWYAI